MNLSFSSVVKFLILNLFPVISLVFVVAFGLQLFFGGGNESIYGLVLFLLATSVYHASRIICEIDSNRELVINTFKNTAFNLADDVERTARKNDANEKLIKEMSSEILNLKQRLNIVEDVNKGGF